MPDVPSLVLAKITNKVSCETLLSWGGWQDRLSLIAAGVYDADILYTKLKTANSIHRAEVKVTNSVHRAEVSKPEENSLID